MKKFYGRVFKGSPIGTVMYLDTTNPTITDLGMLEYTNYDALLAAKGILSKSVVDNTIVVSYKVIGDLAVLKYQFVVDKPIGMPDAWPSEIVELGTFPPDARPGWVQMTISEYLTHVATNRSAYDTWYDSYRINSVQAKGENYLVQEHNAFSLLTKETWYRDKSALGTYSVKAKETTYSYTGTAVTQAVTKWFTVGGTEIRQQTLKYYMDLATKKLYTERE